MIAGALAVAASGLAIFVAPGALLLGAAGARMARGEAFAFAFAASLALLTVTFAALLATSASMSSAPVVLALVTVLACATSSLLPPALSREFPAAEREAMPARLAMALLLAASMAAAVVFAPVGSVDRWWYLAYVRSFAQAPVASLAEPFLGSGQPFARFGVHPWLFGLALWSRACGVDPVTVYERAAPVLVVLASWSAAVAFARALLSREAARRTAVTATMLLWCGGLVPLLARAGEDKILAAGVLVPLCFAALLRMLSGADAGLRAASRGAAGSLDARDALLLALACIATAAVHSLDYAFVLVVAMPVAALAFLRGASGRKAALVAMTLMMAIAAAPAASGLLVRTRLHDIGAELSAGDHPVVRVHEGRDRLVEIPVAGWMVSPRLLLHPLVFVALLAIPALLLRRRGRGDADATSLLATSGVADDGTAGSTSQAGAALGPVATPTGVCSRDARDFFLVATLLPMAIAFVPPLPLLAGNVIPPWMVYRVLWMLPVAPLAALALQRLAAGRRHGDAAATIALLLLCAPVVADCAHDRLAEVRGRLAAPRGADFRAVVDAVRALPDDALLVAAPELAERLPALTARHVVAALDRSTIVFSCSRELGERRLRARAALLLGGSDGPLLAAAASVAPTHALYDPRSTVTPRCSGASTIHGPWALCALDLRGEAPVALSVVRDAASSEEKGGGSGSGASRRELAEATCGQTGPSSGRDPWSAAAPVVACRVKLPDSGRDGLFLRIESSSGRAADELRVDVNGVGLATARVSGDATTTVALPPLAGDTLDVRIASSFLPFVKVKRVVLEGR